MTQHSEAINACEASGSFKYEPSTGLIFRLVSAGRGKAGSVAGRKNSAGYIDIQYHGRRYAAHRLAWLLVHGRWPSNQIDHINGERSDNRLSNIRECTHAENHQNRALRSDNKSGCPGVYWAKHASKWCARIKVKGSPRRLIGYFDSVETASDAYLAAKRELHTFAPEVRKGGC